MPRFALKIEYDGGPFSGWQRQREHSSVQGSIEAALAKIEPIEHKIAAAGRTDAGVHGLGQVAHCDLERDWTPNRLSEALNFHLKPLPIAIVDCAVVSDEFHARFSAQERRYRFDLVARRAPITHLRGRAWQVRYPMKVDAILEGAQHLIGTHDFTTFRSTMCQAASPVKTMDEITITPFDVDAGQGYRFHLRARSFLHNQVRSIMGTLERVGAGKWHPDRVKEVLEARDRVACGPVSPPCGLYLEHVTYPNDPFA
jgi:tRNA pseudouridine38-40 synthase